jgi:SHS2 domain-containing protein
MQTDTETWWLKANVYGYGVKGFKTEIKAVTYNELKLKEDEDGNWVAEVVFDI